MAKRRGKKRSYSAAPRRAYYAPKKKRRTSTLNRSTKKPMQAAGVLIGGVAIPYGDAIVQSVKGLSAKPIAAALMNKENAIKAAKAGAVGYIAGTAVGVVTDKTGLKRPVNKAFRLVRGLF